MMNISKIKNQISKVLILGFLGFLFFGSSVNAARIIFEPAQMKQVVGDQFTVDIMIDTQGQSANALDLTILYPQLLEAKSISKKNSLISLWVNEPSFTKDTIRLIGGRPGGFKTSGGLVARVIFNAKAIGQGGLGLGPESMVLLNDGRGTPTALGVQKNSASINPRKSGKKAAISVGVEEETEELNVDYEKPEKFEVNINREPEIFNNKYFVSFYAYDPDSGVDHYEIKEGSGVFKIAQSPYLLSDQRLHSVIRVRAYDVAGNWRQTTYPGIFKRIWWWIIDIL